MEHEFPEIEVEYHEGVPTSDEFFKNEFKSKRSTLLIFDDLYDSVVKSDAMSRAFKVYSKKMNFSIILTSQSYFEKGSHASTIRSNMEAVITFENYGRHSLNKQVADQLGYLVEYKYGREVFNYRHGYLLYNLSPHLPSRHFRVCSNIFGENGDLPTFYTH